MKKVGGLGGQNRHFEGLKATSAQLYSHRRVSPISRFAANRDPDSRFPAESGNGPFPDSRFPAKSGIGGTGIGDFRVWFSWCFVPGAAALDEEKARTRNDAV